MITVKTGNYTETELKELHPLFLHLSGSVCEFCNDFRLAKTFKYLFDDIFHR